MSDQPIITSSHNPRVKAVTRLHQAKDRQEAGLILIEGRHPVEEALTAGVELTEVFLREGEAPLAAGCPQFFAAESVMAKLATTDSAPPVVAVGKRPVHPAEVLFSSTSARVLGTVDLQDPGNLGSLIRSACAFGVSALLTVGIHVDPYHPKVIRASTGLVFRLPVATLPNTATLESLLARHPDVTPYGTDAHQGESYKAAVFPAKTLLLMGGEAHGLPKEVWNFAKPLHIPMSPGVESLNVGVSAGIILAEAFQGKNHL